MKDAQKPDHVSLMVLVNRLREGRYVIPDFQREFERKPWDISELMRSIFLDYFIGSLLLWKGKKDNFESLACEPIYGFQGQGTPEHIVLDGQQRLTAMYYTFMAPNVPAPSRANRFLYFIRVDRFMADAYDEAFEYDWTLDRREDTRLRFGTVRNAQVSTGYRRPGRPGDSEVVTGLRAVLEEQRSVSTERGERSRRRGRSTTHRKRAVV